MSEADPLMAAILENPPKDAMQFRAILDALALAFNDELPSIGKSIDDVVIAEHEGQNLSVDIHVPRGEGPFPVLIYLHGGGWIMGSPKTHRRLAFRFAEAGYLVFNVHYRLAPEHPFPAAFDDCLEALQWVRAHAADYGGDPQRLAVGGDSAGGNLTAALAAAVDDDSIKSVLLIYPALDFATMDGELAEIPGLEIDLVGLMTGSYIGHNYDALIGDPRVSPIHVAERLPPVHITCGTADGLIDDCRRLEDKLKAAGVRHKAAYYQDMPHGFAQMEDIFPEARHSIQRMIGFLDATLAEG